MSGELLRVGRAVASIAAALGADHLHYPALMAAADELARLEGDQAPEPVVDKRVHLAPGTRVIARTGIAQEHAGRIVGVSSYLVKFDDLPFARHVIHENLRVIAPEGEAGR